MELTKVDSYTGYLFHLFHLWRFLCLATDQLLCRKQISIISLIQFMYDELERSISFFLNWVELMKKIEEKVSVALIPVTITSLHECDFRLMLKYLNLLFFCCMVNRMVLLVFVWL